MPLFGNRFSPKKGVPRKASSLSNLNLDASTRHTEFGTDYGGPIKLMLGENEMVFDQGQWISEKTGEASNVRDLRQQRHVTKQLQEENNLLRVKLDLLLDMLARTTADMHAQENEIEQLKKLSKRKK